MITSIEIILKKYNIHLSYLGVNISYSINHETNQVIIYKKDMDTNKIEIITYNFNEIESLSINGRKHYEIYWKR